MTLALEFVVLIDCSAVFAGETKPIDKTPGGLEVFATDGRISADGSTIVLVCSSNIAFPNDTNAAPDVYVRDVATGAFELISVTPGGVAGNNPSDTPRISADGRFVAFTSSASNLLATPDTNGTRDTFVRDRLLQTTQRVSVSSTGAQGLMDATCDSISADGRFVGFSSASNGLVAGDFQLDGDAFLHDRATHTTIRVSVDANGSHPQGDAFTSLVSGDGNFVAFMSTQALVPGANTGNPLKAYRKDLVTGAVSLLSVSTAGTLANDLVYVRDIDFSGRYVLLDSQATNFVPGDTTPYWDVLVRDVTNATTELINVLPGGGTPIGSATAAALSSNGRYVLFNCAGSVTTEDTNISGDAFLRDRWTNTTIAVSIAPDGHTPASFPPQVYSDSVAEDVTDDGKHLLFSAVLPNITEPPTTGSAFTRFYLRDTRGFQNLKGGLKGTHGQIPALAGSGSLGPLGVGSLTLGSARPSSATLWVLSTQLADQPFAGGILRAFPVVTMQFGVTDVGGTASIPFMLAPLPVLVPQACVQVLVDDPVAAKGVAISNALLLGFE